MSTLSHHSIVQYDTLLHLESLTEREHATLLSAFKCLRSERNNVVYQGLNCGVDPLKDRPLTIPSNSYMDIKKAYGIHPLAIDSNNFEQQLMQLKERLIPDHAVAIGEIGLDLRKPKKRVVSRPDSALQKKVLLAQLKLAQEMSLPVILHQVGARQLLLDILSDVPLNKGGVLHAFTGPKELIVPWEKLGFYFSMGAIILNPRALRLREAVTHIPLNRILVESDYPNHTVPTLMPWDITGRVVAEIAILRGVERREINEVVQQNWERLFG